MADKQSRGLSIEVEVDVSEALTGLKALQREAKESTRTLRELEEARRQLNGLNLYTVWNGDYYTEVLVIANDDSEAIALATEVYKSEERSYDNLGCDLIIENIRGPVASELHEG